jgi:hypothetical protein
MTVRLISGVTSLRLTSSRAKGAGWINQAGGGSISCQFSACPVTAVPKGAKYTVAERRYNVDGAESKQRKLSGVVVRFPGT